MTIKKRMSQILILILMLTQATSALAVPQQPHQFYGSVTINGSPAPDGTEIDAYIDGVLFGSTTTTDGSYGYNPLFYVTADDPDTGGVEGGVNGDVVDLYADDVYVQGYAFSVGGITELDLEFSAHDVTLLTGWNLVGFPVLPDDSSIDLVLEPILENINSVWTYDSGGGWSSYAPGAPSSLGAISSDLGYWVNVAQDVSFTIYGSGGGGSVVSGGSPLDGQTIKIGYISSTTAGLETTVPLVEDIIEPDLNAFAAKLGYDVTFDFVIEDATGQAAVHLEKVQEFNDMGISIFMGGGWSSQAYGSLSYCNDNDMLMVSSSSTSPLLAMSDDNLYRFCPDDTIQAPAISAMLLAHGIEAVVVMQRGDAWADGIYNYFEPAYTGAGGVIIDRIRYAGEATEFSNYLQTADDLLEAAIAEYGAEHVGLEIISFSESVVMAVQAVDYPSVYGVTWFGSDGTTLSQQHCDDAPDETVHVKLYSPYAAPAESEKFTDLYDRYYALVSQPFGYYSACSYDIAHVLAASILMTQSTDALDVIPVFSDVAYDHFGASGWTRLNDAGDRYSSNYQIWGYRYEGAECRPYVAGLYDGISGTVSWYTAEMGYTPPTL